MRLVCQGHKFSGHKFAGHKLSGRAHPDEPGWNPATSPSAEPHMETHNLTGLGEDLTTSIVSGLLCSDLLGFDDRVSQRIPALPLTPPDSAASDCAISDFQEMSSSHWTPGFNPEDWYPENAIDDGVYSHTTGTDMDTFALFAATQDHIDAIPAWTSQPQDSVDTGMSPSLSYTSQSSRSLNAFPDPDHLWTTTAVLPSSVPMVRHASGSTSGMPTYSMPSSSSGDMATLGQSGQRTGFIPGYHVNHVPIHSSRPGHAVNAQGQMSWISTGQVLSRTRLDNRSSISHASDTQDNSVRRSQPIYSLSTYAMDHSSLPVAASRILDQGNVSSPPAGISSKATLSALPSIVDPTADDFSTLIDFPLEDSFPVDHSRTSMSDQIIRTSFTESWPTATSELLNSVPSDLPMPYQTEVVPSQARIAPRRVSTVTMNGVEVEDGRYRTDPLYARSAEADGLYHCPFARSEYCGHAPTKLKCNYDKFIDSHLKPFRCKMAECAKQAFSSTACLLRHEREAHGMHGHGKCPHLCPVPGCERSEPGRGFPRLYNCKDHQRRAHGITSPPSSPIVATAAAPQPSPSKQRKASVARKRKAAPKENAVSRRHKHIVDPTGQGHSRQVARDATTFDESESSINAAHDSRRFASRYFGH